MTSKPFTVHEILISSFHLSRELKTLNPVSRKNPFHPLSKCVAVSYTEDKPKK